MKPRNSRLPKEDVTTAPKPKFSNEILCPHCKMFSGWISKDLIYVKGDFKLKCKECGEPCVRVMCGKKEIDEKNLSELADKIRLSDPE